MKVLIRFTHGLGDAVQLTAVLRHLERYRPGWEVDVCSGVGKHSLFRGLCRRTFTDRDGYDRGYDHVYDLGWYENYNHYPDCPNTKVTNCLREVFDIEPDPALLAYAVRPSPGDQAAAARYLRSLGAREVAPGRYGAVVVHHKGNTSPEKKNLECADLIEAAAEARAAGWPVVVLDWDDRTHPDLLGQPGVVACTHRTAPALWRWEGTGDGGRLVALIGAAGWFVGIDSGPGHAAGATDTPSTVVWTGHHPVQFYDLCGNVEHLVPDDHAALSPADRPAVRAYFERHYRHRVYACGTVGAALADQARRRFGGRAESPPPAADAGRRCGFWVPGRPDHAHQAWTIIQDVYLRDAYRTHLRPRRAGVEYVVDVGANVGAFGRLWAERNPDARVAAVEVNASLVPYLRANLRPTDRVFAAACRYGREPLYLLDSVNCDTPKSVGGSRVVGRAEWEAETDRQYGKPREPVPTVTLEQVCEQAGFPRIDVLKLDCENSELDILAHCDLSRVGTIYVESHDPEAWRELLAVRFGDWDVGHLSRSECRRFELWHLVPPSS
jgi:FkbM family methyltransferase